MPKSKHRKDHKKKAAARGLKRSREMSELKRRFLSWAEKKEKELSSSEDAVVMEDSIIG